MIDETGYCIVQNKKAPKEGKGLMKYIPVDHSPKECGWCGNTFKPNTSHQNFCNKNCYRKYGKKF